MKRIFVIHWADGEGKLNHGNGILRECFANIRSARKAMREDFEKTKDEWMELLAGKDSRLPLIEKVRENEIYLATQGKRNVQFQWWWLEPLTLVTKTRKGNKPWIKS